MRKPVLTLGLILAGATLGGGAALAARDTGAAAFEKLIAGKTAGKPQSCLYSNRLPVQISAYGDKLVYRVSSKLVYVNKTTGGCERVARGDALVTRQFQTQACRGDIATTVDLPVGVQTGSCGLGDFVPYTAN